MKTYFKYLLALPFAAAYSGWAVLMVEHWPSPLQTATLMYHNLYVWGAGGLSALISLGIVYLGPDEPNWAKVVLFCSLWVWWVYFLSYTFLSIPLHMAYIGTNVYWFWRLWKMDESRSSELILDEHLRPTEGDTLRQQALRYIQKAEALGLPYDDVKNAEDLVRLERWSMVWTEIIGQLYNQDCTVDEDFYFDSQHPPKTVVLSEQTQQQLEAMRDSSTPKTTRS